MVYSQSGVASENSFDSLSSLVMLSVVAFAIVASQNMFAKIPVFSQPGSPTAVMAVIAGGIVALLVYLPIKYFYSGSTNMTNNQLMSLAALVGLICTYFMLFEIQPGLPSISSTMLGLFMFYYHLDQIPPTQPLR